MTRFIAAVALCAALVAVAVAPSLAQNEVPLGGYTLFPIRCAAGGFTAEERADIIARRAARLLALNDPNALNIRIVQSGRNALIYAGGSLFVTVDPCDARANQNTVMGIARIWANRLRTVYPQAISEKPGVGSSGIGEPQSGTGPTTQPRAPR